MLAPSAALQSIAAAHHPGKKKPKNCGRCQRLARITLYQVGYVLGHLFEVVIAHILCRSLQLVGCSMSCADNAVRRGMRRARDTVGLGMDGRGRAVQRIRSRTARRIDLICSLATEVGYTFFYISRLV